MATQKNSRKSQSGRHAAKKSPRSSRSTSTGSDSSRNDREEMSRSNSRVSEDFDQEL